MSNVNNQFKELVNEAIHNHFHDKTELEMILKDWLHGICEQLDKYEVKAKAWDRVYEAFEKAENEHEFSNGVCTVMNEYESSEADDS